MNEAKKSSGNCDCTPSPEPVRSAIQSPSVPEARRDQDREQEDQHRAADAGLDVHAGEQPDAEVDGTPGSRRGRRAPPICPSSSAEPRTGVSASRFRKPVSMSRARSVPAIAGGEERALHERERQEEREERVRREAGQVRRRAQAVRVDRHQHQRERQRRDPDAGLARTCARSSAARSARPAARRRVTSSASAPSSVRPVFARNTSSSVGWCRLISAARRFSVSSARITVGQRRRGRSSCTANAPGRAAVSVAEAPRAARAAARARRASSGTTSTVGLPISRLQLGGRALGDDVRRGR